MDVHSFGTDSRGDTTHASSAAGESTSFHGSASSNSSFHEPLEEVLITLIGLEGCKIKASKTVLSSCNELIADAIDEHKDQDAVNLGDYSMRSLLGLVEFCQHNELTEATGVKTKSSAIALSDLYQIASDYMFHDLTRHVYESCSEMVDAVPSLACVFLKRNKPDSALARLGLKAVRLAPKEALEDADDDLLKKINRDRLKVIIEAVDWKEYEPELLPHILVKWICAWGGLPIKLDIARSYTKHVQFPSLETRIFDACRCVGMCITTQDVALEGAKGCRVFTNRAMMSAANVHIKEVLEENADKKTVFIGKYSMRAIMGLVEFCQHKDIALTLGEKKKTAAIALAELSQMADDHMFTELADHVYKTCSSMIKDEPWLAFVMLKRTKPGTPLYKLGTKTFRLFPKECLANADDELLKKLNKERLTLVVTQVDWTQKEHDLLPHVLSNWICAWDGLPIKIKIARDLMKKAKIDINGLPSLVLDAGKMTGLIDSSMVEGYTPGGPDITLLGHANCRVRVVKAIMASRNSELKELLYKDPNATSVYVGDYSKRAIIALAEYCHNDHFCQTLGAKDANSAHGLIELANIATNFMFEDLAKDVYQASIRLVDAAPPMALVYFRRCSAPSALNKLALRTFRLRLKDSLLKAPIQLQKLLDNKRLTTLVDQMRWKEEPHMLLKILVEWVKVWDANPAQIHHARYIARDINLNELPDSTLMLFLQSGLVNPTKIRTIMTTREAAVATDRSQPSKEPYKEPAGVPSCDETTASMATAPTSTSASAASSENSWVGRSVGSPFAEDASVVSFLEAECNWANSTK